MNLTCPEGWTKQSELSIVDGCIVPIAGVFGLKISLVSLALTVFLVKLILLGCRWNEILQKEKTTIILLIWLVVNKLVIAARPLVGLISGLYPENNLGLAFMNNASGVSAAGIVILFIYIQVKVLAKSAMGKTNWLYSNKKIILIILGAVQAFLFLLGPFLSYFLSVPLYKLFWGVVVVIDFTVIPYFCTLGIMIYRKIANSVQKDVKKSVGRRLLITVILCSVLGFSTGAIGVFSIIINRYEWALVELAWMADTVFDIIFFAMFIRNKSKT